MDRLSDRMRMNVGLIDKGSSVADIGCDHGYVSIYLMEKEIATKVVAMDVVPGPLERARKHIAEAGLEDVIEVRLSDGACELKILPDGTLETDAILIAGMGGHLALRIVEDSIDKFRLARYFILQIQSDIPYVREQLNKMGFAIVDEDMVCEDGKYYTAIKFAKGESTDYTDEELIYGPRLIEKKHPVLVEFLNYEHGVYKEIYNSINSRTVNMSAAGKRSDEVGYRLQLIDRLLECMD